MGLRDRSGIVVDMLNRRSMIAGSTILPVLQREDAKGGPEKPPFFMRESDPQPGT